MGLGEAGPVWAREEEIEPVQVGTEVVTWDEVQLVQDGTRTETLYNDVDIYVDEDYGEDVPVYETQDVEYTVETPIYESVTDTWGDT